jgi:integrase
VSQRPEPGVKKDEKRRTWFYVIDAPGRGGKRRQEKKRGFATMTEANRAVIKRRQAIRAGNVPVPDDDSVAAFRDAWISALPAEGIEPATVKHYAESTARLMPTIATTKLQDLTALDLDRAYGALRELGRSARTIRASHIAVKKMLTEALRVGKIAHNVAADARPPRARAARAQVFPTWTSDQLETFLAAVADNAHVSLWTFAAWTGMREGELVALRWDDVEIRKAEGHVNVCRSVGKGTGGVYDKEPKTDAGRRTVELDEELVSLLRAHRKAQNEQRLAVGSGWADSGLVFCEVDGSPIHPARLSKRWSDLVRRHSEPLGVPRLRFHDLRHSHCTQLLDAGVRPDVVTERLGHSSVAFTLQRYGHRYAGDQRSGLARLRQTKVL